MGFLKNLIKAVSGGSAYRPTVEAVPQLASVIPPMKQSNVQPALQLYTASTNDPELRFRLIELTASTFGNESSRGVLMDAWANNTPNDPFAVLVRAKTRVESAPTWYPDDPEDVADRARAAHAEAGRFALGEYQRIAAMLPNDPVPWALMLELSMVFELDGKKQMYKEVQRRYPGFFPAQLSMHHALSAMWWGDHAQSVGFMRQVAAQAPVGSDLHALVAYSHFRVYLYEKFHGETSTAGKQVLENPAVQQEVHAGFERSIWSPQYRPGYWTLFCRHVAAAWFSENNDQARMKAELERVGDTFDENESPWNMSTAAYANIRKSVGL